MKAILKLIAACLLALPLLACANMPLQKSAMQGQSEFAKAAAEIEAGEAVNQNAIARTDSITAALLKQESGDHARALQHIATGLVAFNQVVETAGKYAEEIKTEHTWWFGWRTHQLAKWTLIIGGLLLALAFAIFVVFLGIVNGLAGPIGPTAVGGWLVKAVRYVITLGYAGFHDIGAWLGKTFKVGLKVANAAQTISVSSMPSAGPGTQGQPIAQ